VRIMRAREEVENQPDVLARRSWRGSRIERVIQLNEPRRRGFW